VPNQLTQQACGQHARQLVRHEVEVQRVVVGVQQRKAGVKGEEHGDDNVEQPLTAAGRSGDGKSGDGAHCGKGV
jgi:hypothetical protein